MSYNDANSIVRTWLDYANARNAAGLASLYSEEAVLLPTFSPHTLRTDAARRQYFDVLTTRKGLVVSLHEKTVVAQALGSGIEIISGIYRFQVDIDDEPLVFEARFSYVVDTRLPRPILQHHSSQIPRTLS